MTTSPSPSPIHVIGGGLAGSEAAWQIANAGVPVILHEMRGVPGVKTDAHQTDGLADLGERARRQRQPALPVVEQAKGERIVQHHAPQKPCRWARLVKKMPLGASTVSSSIGLRVVVS